MTTTILQLKFTELSITKHACYVNQKHSFADLLLKIPQISHDTCAGVSFKVQGLQVY